MDHCKTLVFMILNVLGVNMNHYKTKENMACCEILDSATFKGLWGTYGSCATN